MDGQDLTTAAKSGLSAVVDQPKHAAPAEAAAPAAAPAPTEQPGLWDFLTAELGDAAHQVAVKLEADLPDLVSTLAGAAVAEAPALLGAVLKHPFMQHLEVQLPTASLGIVHGLLGLKL
jgi:hypothetical protein